MEGKCCLRCMIHDWSADGFPEIILAQILPMMLNSIMSYHENLKKKNEEIEKKNLANQMDGTNQKKPKKLEEKCPELHGDLNLGVFSVDNAKNPRVITLLTSSDCPKEQHETGLL